MGIFDKYPSPWDGATVIFFFLLGVIITRNINAPLNIDVAYNVHNVHMNNNKKQNAQSYTEKRN